MQRGTRCNRDTFKVAGYHKPTKRRMFLMFLKKLMKINSPSMGPLGYIYEYDYLKEKYFKDDRKRGATNKCVQR